jgi:hypothetical protein
VGIGVGCLIREELMRAVWCLIREELMRAVWCLIREELMRAVWCLIREALMRAVWCLIREELMRAVWCLIREELMRAVWTPRNHVTTYTCDRMFTHSCATSSDRAASCHSLFGPHRLNSTPRQLALE